ncbi:hypothetical protein [Microbacterium sp. NPDC077184]|uniref:hypothetical protein n=1 Tax=Microbacterium sp. NPDC077184 TaxID=3154764 RepID=UPI0034435CFF
MSESFTWGEALYVLLMIPLGLLMIVWHRAFGSWMSDASPLVLGALGRPFTGERRWALSVLLVAPLPIVFAAILLGRELSQQPGLGAVVGERLAAAPVAAIASVVVYLVGIVGIFASRAVTRRLQAEWDWRRGNRTTVAVVGVVLVLGALGLASVVGSALIPA